MKRPAKPVLLLSAGIALLAGAMLLALDAIPDRVQWWTDGGAIRVAEKSAPVREVLWLPAEPLKGADFGSSDEYEPRYSADGTTVVFVRRRPGQNADLYAARWSPAGWSAATPIESINTPNDELGPELSHDGASLYFYSDRPGGLGGYDLWVSSATDGSWGTPTNLGPTVNSAWNEYGPALYPTGDRLYFSSNRPRPGEPVPNTEGWSATIREHRTRHDYDLYVSDVGTSTLGEARAIESLNTAADEGAPAVSPAGDFLYFASDRSSSLGGFDIFRVRLQGGGVSAEVENLGSSINSVSNDLDPALSSDGFRLSFSSDREANSPDGVPPTRKEASTSGVGRYSLWTSSSREVYRYLQSGESRLPALWRKVWPWLLVFLALMPLLLLYRLLREQSWRQRFVRLSLLAQCVVLSILAHVGIASALTIWKVGTGIIESMHAGGGTRVVLTSGGLAGSVAGQLQALSTMGNAELPEPGRFEMPVLVEPVGPGLAHVNLPPLDMPAVISLTTPIQTRAERPALMSATDAMPARSGEVAAAVPRSDVPHALAEPHAEPPVMKWEEGAPATGLTFGTRIDTPLPDAGVGEESVLLAPDIASVESRDLPHASSREGPVPLPDPTAKVGVPRIADLQSPAGEPSNESEVVVGKIEAPAPATIGTPRPGRVDVALKPMNTPNDLGSRRTGTLGPELTRAESLISESVSGPATRISGVAPIAVAGGDISQQRLPSVARPESRTPTEAGDQRVAASAPALAPASAGFLPSTSERSSSAFVSPLPATRASEPETGSIASGLGIVTTPSRGRSGAGVMSPLGSPGIAVSRNTNSGSQIPLGIPVPIETFDQRAPESRSELVEKMGGSEQTERAVGLALDWFVHHQSADGHWSAEHFDDGCGQCKGPAEFKADAAMTGMVLLCYLGAGHTHTQDGPYRETVKKGLAWLVKRQAADGDLRRGETMYGQTASAVALCEAFAMSRDPELAEPARKAVEFVLERAGRQESSNSRDTSVLGWLVFTVESARRAGFTVPQTTFDAARHWLDYVAKRDQPGRYAYTRGGPASAAMTAEAMFVQQLLGHIRDEPMMQQSARFVLSTPPKWQEGAPTYYWYYATLALFQHQRDEWKLWNEQLVRELLAHQEQQGPASGSWEPTDPWSRMGGRVYQTAVCTLSLEVYYRYKAK